MMSDNGKVGMKGSVEEAKGPRIGVAMIVRNGAATMGRALEPFRGVADEFAILLGGESSDGTALVAATFATMSVHHYAGALDEDGRLLDFAAARQQATELLTADWMVVVDADDVWAGVEEHLRALVADVNGRKIGMVEFPYHVGKGQFAQPRLFRLGSGRWRGPVHEYWELEPEWEVALTGLIRLEQQQTAGQRRPGHNIRIAERYLEGRDLAEDPRTAVLLARDYVDAERYEDALALLKRYLLEVDDKEKERKFQAHYCRAAAFLRLGRYADALQSAAMAMTARPYGMAWTVMGEAALRMGRATGSEALYELSLMCVERAVNSGQRLMTAWSSVEMVTTIPLLIRAGALTGLKRYDEALAAADLVLGLDPEYDEAKQVRAVLCGVTGEV